MEQTIVKSTQRCTVGEQNGNLTRHVWFSREKWDSSLYESLIDCQNAPELATKVKRRNQQAISPTSLLYTNNSKTFHTCSLNAIIMYEEESPSSIPIKLDDFDRQDCTIVGSCDGLFCIMNKFRNIFVIWNPSTREFRQFPHLSSTGLSPQAYGFCYNERQNDHKVVVIARSNDSDQYGGFSYEVNSYSLRTNSWQKILELTSATVGRFGYEIGALVNGRLHWIAAYPKPKAKVRSETFIFSLDLDDATYGKVALPNPEDKSEFEWYLDTLGGNLCVLYEYTLEDEFPRTDVWVMKEYGVVESWTRVISIPFCFIPLFMFQNDEILLHTDSNAMLYNSTHNSFKDPKNQINLGGGEIVVYIESLVSPNYN
ncbi:F-box/kelch-repeat protein At3g23880-like [Lycium ferocissimum]|uniref:F-box/kelch-repeat protein At3g23880-like n=1 Tax=Lycium ferocissimum TaxID=112874 RepID=UPI0028151AB3|nr:F-box/kelch-repeat protein At3g23880-like [Lycium ferocissimum]